MSSLDIQAKKQEILDLLFSLPEEERRSILDIVELPIHAIGPKCKLRFHVNDLRIIDVQHIDDGIEISSFGMSPIPAFIGNSSKMRMTVELCSDAAKLIDEDSSLK